MKKENLLGMLLTLVGFVGTFILVKQTNKALIQFLPLIPIFVFFLYKLFYTKSNLDEKEICLREAMKLSLLMAIPELPILTYSFKGLDLVETIILVYLLFLFITIIIWAVTFFFRKKRFYTFSFLVLIISFVVIKNILQKKEQFNNSVKLKLLNKDTVFYCNRNGFILKKGDIACVEKDTIAIFSMKNGLPENFIKDSIFYKITTTSKRDPRLKQKIGFFPLNPTFAEVVEIK